MSKRCNPKPSSLSARKARLVRLMRRSSAEDRPILSGGSRGSRLVPSSGLNQGVNYQRGWGGGGLSKRLVILASAWALRSMLKQARDVSPSPTKARECRDAVGNDSSRAGRPV